MSEFNGKTVLVTGSSSGIGKAVALAFGEAGANVVVNYHSSPEGAEEVTRLIIQSGGKAIAVKADVSKEAEVSELFAKTLDAYGKLDILVSNAGLQQDNDTEVMTLAQWQKVIDVNLTGQFLCAREAVKCFNQQRQVTPKGSRGNIIMMSSVHDIIPWAGHTNYAASKGGLLLFMKSLALEVARQKIRVNAISPGAIKTDINKEVWSDPASAKKLLKLIPYGRIGDAQDVAKTALWLGSDDSDYVTGTTIYVDGGMTLYPGFVDNG